MSSLDYAFTDCKEEILMEWIPIEVCDYSNKGNPNRSTMYQCSNCGNLSEVAIVQCQYCCHRMVVSG